MSHSNIGSRVRQWLQWCFGILALEKAAKARHDELVKLVVDMTALEIINERLGRLENMFTSNHVSRPRQAVAYDWEQIQLQELAEMMKNKPEDS